MTDSSDLERMGRELKCPICLSLMNSAVSLTCNHVFCNSCIEKSMKSASNCPVCKIPYRRREVRPAPHMDNLVSIYKSMEIASGVNIFVTQAAPSIKLSDEDYQRESNEICRGQESGAINLMGPANRRRLKGNWSKKTSKINLEGSDLNPGKPSFPTKKRVQVTQYPPPETPARLANVESVKGEFIKDGPEKSLYLSKEKPVFNERGEPVFSPFFWLREDEEIEKLSQQTNGDHDIYTPPKAPSFSDIKDSDDEMPSKMTPNGGTHIALNDADYFDSEMFEWTQRACSPELCSTPMKMQVTYTDDFDGVQEKKSRASSEAATTVKVPRSGTTGETVVSKRGVASAEVNLCTSSSPGIKTSNSGYGIKRSSKRGRKAAEKPQMQAKRTKGEVLGILVPLVEVTDGIIQEKKIDNSGNLLDLEKEICRRDEEIEFDIRAKEPTPENIPILSAEAKSPNLGDETVVNDCPTSLDKRESTGEILKLKKTGRGCKMGNVLGQRDQPVRSRTRNPNSANNNMAQHDGKEDLVSKSANILFPVVHDNKASDLCNRMGKSQNKTKINPKCDTDVRLSEKSKILTCNVSEDKLVNHSQEGHKKDQGKSNVGLSNDLSEMDVTLPSSGFLLRKCEGVVNKIQCAFCHSTEDSETSGVMVHYLNGKPVAADYNGGAKVIHAHRNCTEWAPNVYFEDDAAINLEAELVRSRRIKCCCCDVKGAALGCYERSCRKSFHFPCAKLIPQCRWDNDNFVMLCPLHASYKLPSELSECQVERKKKRNPKRQSFTHQTQVAVKHAISNNTCCPWNSCGPSKKLVLCCSGIMNEEREIVSEFERLSGVVVLKNWDSRVTHIIASTDVNGACRRTLKILMGILEGKWILNIEWIKACMKAKELVDEEGYEIGVDIHGIRDGPQLGRLRLLNKQPKLFEGCKFYFMGDFIPSYKGYLHDLVTAAGGTILHRKPISGDQNALTSGCLLIYIIYSVEVPDKSDPSSRNAIFNRRRSAAEVLASSIGAMAASNSWVLNSISGCKLQPLVD